MVNYAFNLAEAPQFPWIGMETSTGIANPGFSVWVFQAPARIFGITTPLGLNCWVQSLNIFALFLLVLFIFKCVPIAEQELWIWGAILMALNPMAILFSRKLWAQCVLPPFSVLFFASWWMRDRKWGAFLWGISGLLLGQIHISGLFLTLAVFLWTAGLGARLKETLQKKVQWKAWALGSALGMIGVIQWLRLVHGQKNHKFDLSHLLSIQFWRYWIADSLGIQLSYTLHGLAFRDFWRYPLITGQASYLIGAVHVFLYAVIVILILKLILKWLRSERRVAIFLGTDSNTNFLLSSVLIGYGFLITASGSLVQHHYLIVIFPLLWVGLARAVFSATQTPRPWLAAIALAQAVISIGFLSYIHVNQGAPESDYGITYGAQLKAGNAP